VDGLADTPTSGTSSLRKFRLQIEGELVFRRGQFSLIVGPTGSGKTSLLMALLGEIHFIPAGPGSWFNLPRGGGVAFAAQESWVLSQTIKDNIIFGSPYNEERYHKGKSELLSRDSEATILPQYCISVH
jgi:ABC-type iron transport system FetAB ATPase subunit